MVQALDSGMDDTGSIHARLVTQEYSISLLIAPVTYVQEIIFKRMIDVSH